MIEPFISGRNRPPECHVSHEEIVIGHARGKAVRNSVIVDECVSYEADEGPSCPAERVASQFFDRRIQIGIVGIIDIEKAGYPVGLR